MGAIASRAPPRTWRVELLVDVGHLLLQRVLQHLHVRWAENQEVPAHPSASYRSYSAAYPSAPAQTACTAPPRPSPARAPSSPSPAAASAQPHASAAAHSSLRDTSNTHQSCREPWVTPD